MLEKVDLNKSVDKENDKKLRDEMDVKLGELQRAAEYGLVTRLYYFEV